jgi:hypothetical protein
MLKKWFPCFGKGSCEDNSVNFKSLIHIYFHELKKIKYIYRMIII